MKRELKNGFKLSMLATYYLMVIVLESPDRKLTKSSFFGEKPIIVKCMFRPLIDNLRVSYIMSILNFVLLIEVASLCCNLFLYTLMPLFIYAIRKK